MRPLAGAREPDSLIDRMETYTKLGLPLLGLLYVLGFVVDALYLAKYGVSPLGLVRAQYLLAGIWALVPLAMLVSAVAVVAWAIMQDRERVKADRQKETTPAAAPGRARVLLLKIFPAPVVEFLAATYRIAGVLFGMALFVVASLKWAAFQFPAAGEPLTLRRLASFVGPVTGYAVGIFVCAGLSIAGLLKHEGFRKFAEVLTGMVLATTFLVGYLGYFSAKVYPLIPATVGGGQPVRVRFLLKEPIAGLITSPGQRLTQPYDLLASSEKTLVIIDGAKSMEFSRDLVQAVIVERLDQSGDNRR